ncbi:309_t:CDS:2 [Entrophospora sp. SA101]|nr:309_t:CDS:2 [Entrophospora sp. SA101]
MESPSLPSTGLEKTNQNLTKNDLQRIESSIDFILESLQQSSKDNKSSSLSRPNNNNVNSIVLDLPLLIDSKPEEKKHESPLSALLNHTYPKCVVDLAIITINHPPCLHQISGTTIPQPPSKELCQKLIQDYFKKFNPVFPILDRKRFIDLWRSKSIYSELLVNSTMAYVASRSPYDPSIQNIESKPGGVFFDAAKKILDSVYEKPKLETIQALLLLSLSESNISRRDSSFMFLGMAVSMSNCLQLERVNDSLSSEESEERRRVFYCIYCRNRWVSFIHAKPYSVDDMDINVPLPELLNFDQQTKSFFIALIKLSHILGQIWKFGYTTHPKACYEHWQSHVADPKSMLRQIRSALAKWLKELPDELQYQYLPDADPGSLLHLSSFSVFSGYINILFHTCLLLLHQPYLTNSSPLSLSSKTNAQQTKYHNYNPYQFYNPAFGASNKYVTSSSQFNNVPIKTCLTAATTITDISRTTRKFDKTAFCNFIFPVYGILQAVMLESVIISNGTIGSTAEYAQEAKKVLNDTFEELKCVGKAINVAEMTDVIKEQHLYDDNIFFDPASSSYSTTTAIINSSSIGGLVGGNVVGNHHLHNQHPY